MDNLIESMVIKINFEKYKMNCKRYNYYVLLLQSLAKELNFNKIGGTKFYIEKKIDYKFVHTISITVICNNIL